MDQAMDEPRGGLSPGHAKPQTFEELLAVLSAGTARLPRRLKEVAIHLTQYPDDAALSTISEYATAAGVQPSTLVRFAQNVGFSGWSELQDILKAHLKSSRRAEPASLLPDQLSGFAAAAQASLDRLPNTLDPIVFDILAGALARAPVVTLIGSKRAFPVTAYLSLTLSQHGLRNVLVDNIGSSAFDQVGCLGPADCALAVSFSPYNSVTPELAALARERGARLLALTDSPLSPLVPISEASLIVVEKAEGGYRTLAATMVVALALAVETAARRARLQAG